MSRVSKLFVAAVLAASLPALAAAGERDHDHDRDCAHGTPAGWAPAAYPRPAPHRWREVSWRERELAHLRADLHALEEARADFHARHGWRGRRSVRFERWYAARRAELERRWYELQAVAWR